jgi:hypothetical protein
METDGRPPREAPVTESPLLGRGPAGPDIEFETLKFLVNW